MGSAKNALATKTATRKDLLWEVPESWSLAEAATIPTAYMTAYYSLVMRGRLRKGMRVLIHSATGAVGLAAVRICLNRGAEVRSFSLTSLRFSNVVITTVVEPSVVRAYPLPLSLAAEF